MQVPHCAQAAPYEVDAEEGKSYYWCTCGLSEKQPFCDGSHAGSGMRSEVFTANTSGKIWLCGCKATKNPPYCDGSHTNLGD